MLSRSLVLVASLATLAGPLTGVWSPAAADELKRGDWVSTVNDAVPVMVKKETLFRLARNSDLCVEEVNGKWLAITVTKGKTPLRGWVKREHVTPVEIEAEVHKRPAGALDSMPAEKKYIAFSLAAAQKRIAPSSGNVVAALFGGSGGTQKFDPEVACLGGMTTVRGLVVDPETGDAIVVGQYFPGRERLTIDDLVVALRARFVHNQWPVVSIDPPPQPTRPPYHKVRFEGGVKDTGFGYTLYEADYLLKKISLGKSPTLVSEVPSQWDLWVEERRNRSGQSMEVSSRAWFFPILAATPACKNVAAYKGLQVGVFSEVMAAKIGGRPVTDLTQLQGHTGERFTNKVRDYYDELAAMHPSFRRIEQLNELVALSRAIEVMEQRPDLSWWLQNYDLREVQTPRQAAELARSVRYRYSRGYRYQDISMSGGVQLRTMALRLQAGDVSALSDAVLALRPSRDALTWSFIVDDWVIPVPPDRAIKRGEEVTPQLIYAQFLIRQKKYTEALERLDQIVEIEPNYVDAWYQKAVLLSEQMNRHEEALKCLDIVLEKVSDSPDALYARGLVHTRLGNTQKAIDDYTAALAVNPQLQSALANRGVRYAESGEFQKALADFDQALRLDPACAFSYGWRGVVHKALGDRDKALADFKRSLRINKSQVIPRAYRGILYSEEGKHAEAIVDFSILLEDHADNKEIRRLRADAYRKLGRFAEALSDYQQVGGRLTVEVTAESAQLQDGGRTTDTVYQGEELVVTRADGDRLWVTENLGGVELKPGWIQRSQVR